MGGGALVGGAGGAAGGGGTGAIDGGGAGADGNSDGSVTGDGGTPPVLAPPPLTGLAVINDNYTAMASSLSVLGAAGGVAHADCVDSATGGGGTGSSTLTSDVTLPSQPQRGGDIVVIDRGHTALTFVNPASCAVDRQISVAGGFPRANPHDVVIISDTKAYVTRYEKNLVATTPAATGDDVLIIDPRDGSALGRIDLSSYAAQVPGSGATVQARPDRAVIAAGKVVVTLNNQDANFAVFGEGRLVVIDPATDTVLEALPLTALTDCEALAVVPGSATVLVTCGGAYTDADPASRSGLAVVDLGGASATLVRTFTGTALGGTVNFQWVVGAVAGSTTRAFLSLFGATDFTTGATTVPDAALAVDLATGATTGVLMAQAYAIGRGTLSSGGQLLLPDASDAQPRIHVIDVTGTPTETSAFAADTVLNLAPREVAAY
jgi:hypothetical protein